jgi:hypothetical protein
LEHIKKAKSPEERPSGMTIGSIKTEVINDMSKNICP